MTDDSFNRDFEHLKLLSIFHYVIAGMMAFFSCFPFIYVAFGLFMILAPDKMQNSGNGPMPREIGAIMIAFAGVVILIVWLTAAAAAYAGYCLAHSQHYYFCMVVAAFECLHMPYGTVLGVFTIIVLNRPSVRQLFGVGPG